MHATSATESLIAGRFGVAAAGREPCCPALDESRDTRPPSVASIHRCKFARGSWFPGLSLGGCDLLVESVWVGLVVLDSVEVLSVNVGEGRAVAGVAEEQVEDRPHE